jgi:hypothetical protein
LPNALSAISLASVAHLPAIGIMEHMPHALDHLQHFLASFLGSKEFLSALIGAVIGGALTAWSALRAQKQAAADERQRDEETERRTVEGALRAIAAELRVLKTDTLDPLNETLEESAKSSGSGPLMMRRVEQDHAAVFRSNAHLLGRVNDNDLREQIIRVYGIVGGAMDYANTMAKDYELWRSLRGQPDENRELLDKLRILESHLRKGVQVLQSDIPKLLDRIDKYLRR